ncbi:MAG: hypothetical protein WBB60_12830 [Nitrospira sp.]|nr:hypothetical protein [Nitrospira sp.]MBP6604301.1 hypothetical protein [Nitrospira sp.]HQY59349.1 hypothetical protein [Nitrospira sp.]
MLDTYLQHSGRFTMSIGSGIFLGLFSCGIIYLYTQTMDRWNWTRASKVAFVTLVVGILLGLISIGGLFIYRHYHGLPKVITEFKELKLGESLSDATFKLGNPGRFVIELPTNKEEIYSFNPFHVQATLRNGKIVRVLYSCMENKTDFTSLNGIICGDSAANILARFDKEIRILCQILDKQEGPWSDHQRVTRAYDVVKYGIRYKLMRNSVSTMEIASPEDLESSKGDEWQECA